MIIARILRQRTDAERIVYKIAIKKAYKMTEAGNEALRAGKLQTAGTDSMCGRPLDAGRLYVIAGRGDRVSQCSYAEPYAGMSLVERRGFAGGYRKGCACRLAMQFGGIGRVGGVPAPGQCLWDPWDRCESKLGACVPSRAGFNATEPPAKCHWRPSPLYNECVNEP